MLTLKKISAALIAATLVTVPGLGLAKDFATVNGKPISQDIANAFTSSQSQNVADPKDPKFAAAVKEDLIRRSIMAQEAIKKGLDKKPEIIGQVELAKQEVLIRAFLADFIRNNPVSEAELKRSYASLKEQLGGTEYHARHILVETEEEAKAIITKLDKGEKFADLAKASQDPGSKERGGDLGWNIPNSFVKPFSDGMINLKPGTYTKQPVKSDYGYHVILLEETRPLKLPSFEEAKQQLARKANEEKLPALLEELRKKAKVN